MIDTNIILSKINDYMVSQEDLKKVLSQDYFEKLKSMYIKEMLHLIEMKEKIDSMKEKYKFYKPFKLFGRISRDENKINFNNEDELFVLAINNVNNGINRMLCYVSNITTGNYNNDLQYK